MFENYTRLILMFFLASRLPPHPTDDISSPSCTVDEDPFPPESNGPQCVPSTPTLLNDFGELQSEISEWPWQLPTLIQNSENGVVADLFKGYHQVIHGVIQVYVIVLDNAMIDSLYRMTKQNECKGLLRMEILVSLVLTSAFIKVTIK